MQDRALVTGVCGGVFEKPASADKILLRLHRGIYLTYVSKTFAPTHSGPPAFGGGGGGAHARFAKYTDGPAGRA